jgi:hypothetical protein
LAKNSSDKSDILLGGTMKNIKNIVKYYKNNPHKFVEEAFNVKLYQYQRLLLNNHLKFNKLKRLYCLRYGHKFELYRHYNSIMRNDYEQAGYCIRCGFDTHEGGKK